MSESVSVLFVCLGNICRSPTAEGVFAHQVKFAGMERRIVCDSAGTAAYHAGEPPDRRSVQAAASRGYDLSRLRARQVVSQDFERFDYILAMDESNLAGLHKSAPAECRAQLGLFLDYAPQLGMREVPDPYYGGKNGFEEVLDLVEAASQGLLQTLHQRLGS